MAMVDSMHNFRTFMDLEEFEMQKSPSNCIFNIAYRYFTPGSNVGIYSSNIHNQTNTVMSLNSYNVIARTVMSEIRWTIIIKEGDKIIDNRDEVWKKFSF